MTHQTNIQRWSADIKAAEETLRTLRPKLDKAMSEAHAQKTGATVIARWAQVSRDTVYAGIERHKTRKARTS